MDAPTADMSLTDLTCYTCGCSGYNSYNIYLAKCSKCGTSYHQYCMIQVLREVPEDWICRIPPCEEDSKDYVKRALENASEQAQKKKFDYGKVKYISPEEAALLESGGKARWQRQSSLVVKRHASKNQVPGGMPSKRSPDFRAKEEPFSGTQSSPKPVSPSKLSSPWKKSKPNGSFSLKQEIHGMDLAFAPQTVMVEGIATELLPNAACLSKSDQNLFKNGYGSERSQSVLEAEQNFDKAHWKGMFNIQDTSWNTCFEIEAHLLRKWMNDKAYEATNRMPSMVHLKFKPCERIWPNLFKFHPPEGTDIALYFHPSADSRSKVAYNSLLEKVDSEKLGIGCCIANTYLLIFSSRKLSPVLQRDKNGLPYLWGVFCHSKLLSRRALALVPAKSREVALR